MPRRRSLAIAAGAVVIVAAVAAQLALPAVAERNLASELERFGPAPDVQIAAFPALKLLRGRADSVRVRMPVARIGPERLTDRLADTVDTQELDVRIGELRAGPLSLRDVLLRKDGAALRAEGAFADGDLRLSLPSFVDFRPVATPPGQGLLFEGSLSVFGFAVRAQARLKAEGGAVTVRPEGLPLPGLSELATLTVFDDPRVRVISLGAQRRGGGFRLSADARVD